MSVAYRNMGAYMSKMLAVERRWARVMLAAFAPEGGPGLAPQPGEVDYVAAFEALARGASPIARIGVRLALWLVALSPLWLRGQFRTLVQLSPDERLQTLGALLVHRSFAVREATFLMKTVACLALLREDSVRARSGYDGHAAAPRQPRSLVRSAR